MKKLFELNRRFLKKLLKLMGIGGTAFVIQACYGDYPGPGTFEIEPVATFNGKIVEEETSWTIGNASIATTNNDSTKVYFENTSNGEFSIELVVDTNFTVKLFPHTLNLKASAPYYISKDTTIVLDSANQEIIIPLRRE